MNEVEKVKKICKERKIPIYKLEKDCGFANGYISQLKKGTFPSDRLVKISDYLSVSFSELISDSENENITVVKNIEKNISLSDMDETIKTYALKLSNLSKENQELIMNMIDKLL